jgi:hypothetical protein
MEVIEGNFNAVDIVEKVSVEKALTTLLEESDLDIYDEMVVILNSSEGNGTSISTNNGLDTTHFLLHYAAKTILDGDIGVS